MIPPDPISNEQLLYISLLGVDLYVVAKLFDIDTFYVDCALELDVPIPLEVQSEFVNAIGCLFDENGPQVLWDLGTWR